MDCASIVNENGGVPMPLSASDSDCAATTSALRAFLIVETLHRDSAVPRRAKPAADPRHSFVHVLR
jgi:hypothetical protein